MRSLKKSFIKSNNVKASLSSILRGALLHGRLYKRILPLQACLRGTYVGLLIQEKIAQHTLIMDNQYIGLFSLVVRCRKALPDT